MKDSHLIKNIKAQMANFLGFRGGRHVLPCDSLPFSEYLKAAKEKNVGYHRYEYGFCEKFYPILTGILDGYEEHAKGKTDKQNIIFGVLTNGEIFVEVNGKQHTPDDAFYKMATIQSSTLAHQVRDLEFTLKERTEQLEATTKELTRLESKMERFSSDIVESLQNWRPM